MLPTNSFSALLLAGGFLTFVCPEAVAQQPGQPTSENQIDCSAFQRGADGSWQANRQTSIVIDTNTITLSAGIKPRGSVNGISIQDTLERKCAQSSPSAGTATSAPTFVSTYWRASKLALPDCMARAQESVKNFSEKRVAGQSVYAWHDGSTYITRCAGSMVFFAVVGPPNSTAEQNRTAQNLIDQIVERF